MRMILYDKTFEGFLSAVFDIYEYRLNDVAFAGTDGSLFVEEHRVVTNEKNSQRVWKGLLRKISPVGANLLYKSFLSELNGIEDLLLRYMRYAFESRRSIEADYSHEAVLKVSQTAKKVHREKHRMEAFVRFQLSRDGLYYATVEPDFDVLPLIADHFEKRYADQRWMIFDLKRRYGIYYNLITVCKVLAETDESSCANLPGLALDDHEDLYQELWKNYFKSVNIPARKNLKLHIQHMPLRYWKHLTEKQI